MPSLVDMLSGNDTAELTYVDNQPSPLIEPLDGYATVDQIMDRFPEEVYNKSRDSHLYRFIQAICGESGAGILKKQAYIARLKNEGALLTFKDLDTFYTQHFRFPRLPAEKYPDGFDPEGDLLTKAEWDALLLADAKYRNRISLFMQATRLGNSPDGITLTAEAGSGIHCDVFENYRPFYDLLSDDPLGLSFQGITNSIHEFIVIPRIMDADGNADARISYVATIQRSADFTQGTKWAITTTYAVNDIVYPTKWNGHYYQVTAQTGNSGSTEPPFSSNTEGQTFVQGNITYQDIGVSLDDYAYNAAGNNALTPDVGTYTKLDPTIEHNMVNTLDMVRPVGSLMTIEEAPLHFVPIQNDVGETITPLARASSSDFKMVRYVTGRVAVDWPVSTDRSAGHWISPGVETEQVDFPIISRSHPIIWQTVENVHAYTDDALFDSTYGTDDFYGGDRPHYPKYRSEHIGPTQGDFSLIFPFVQSAPKDDLFAAYKAISLQTTPLILEGRHR